MRSIQSLAAFAAFRVISCFGDDVPGVAGYEALARIVRAAHTTDLPVVDRVEVLVLSSSDAGHDSRDTRQRTFLVRPASSNDSDGTTTIPSSEISVTPHSSRILALKNAKRIADDWRSLSFRRNGAFCHVPTYGLRFFRDEELIFSVSVCWKCHNFYLPVVDQQTGRASVALYGFDDNSAAKKLLNDLRRLLPHPDIRHPRLR